jgi:hypothetical protein
VVPPYPQYLACSYKFAENCAISVRRTSISLAKRLFWTLGANPRDGVVEQTGQVTQNAARSRTKPHHASYLASSHWPLRPERALHPPITWRGRTDGAELPRHIGTRASPNGTKPALTVLVRLLQEPNRAAATSPTSEGERWPVAPSPCSSPSRSRPCSCIRRRLRRGRRSRRRPRGGRTSPTSGARCASGSRARSPRRSPRSTRLSRPPRR